ncbi:hypothetical protein BSL78_16232 [Apostichopus japonicus]|uniref:Uncharacterized protein n=1 Tax=Stichopus japonicus TaxID=307972 RepID=A0A2G8KFY8_STIJA|nr:hypothetical protein BSL78_16232 [Apostichopus japonicus]
MAMGRGLTLQIEDGSYSLNSWNSIQPGRVKKSTETRQSHGKKLGGHFQLAVNFQKPKLPAKQLVTPASLMSSTLQPGQKSLSKDRPNFEDAAEDTFSEDEDSSQDEENDDDDDSGDSGTKERALTTIVIPSGFIRRRRWSSVDPATRKSIVVTPRRRMPSIPWKKYKERNSVLLS